MWIPERPRFLLYFTKDSMFRWWFRVFGGNAPPTIGVLAHGSTPTADSSRLILTTARTLRVPLVLFGDLDPGDLTAFAALVAGGVGLRRRQRPSAKVLYGGLEDSFFRLVRRHIGPERFERECLLRMTADELEHLAIVQRLVPSLEALCGGRAVRILEAGYKCELEAILGPHICEGAFLADVRRYLAVRLPSRLGL